MGAESVHLHGFGEPLLDRNLAKKIRYLKERAIPFTYIVSNLALLKKSTIDDLIESGLDKIDISFPTPWPSSSINLHTKLDRKKIVANIKLFQKMKNEKNSLTPKLVLSFHIKLDKKYHKIPGLKYSFDKLLRIGMKLRWGLNCDYKFMYLHNWVDSKKYRQFNSQMKPISHCHISTDRVMKILWNGDVTLCSNDFDGKVKFGNIFESSIASVWNSVEYINTRRKMAEMKYNEIDPCRKCERPFT